MAQNKKMSLCKRLFILYNGQKNKVKKLTKKEVQIY